MSCNANSRARCNGAPTSRRSSSPSIARVYPNSLRRQAICRRFSMSLGCASPGPRRTILRPSLSFCSSLAYRSAFNFGVYLICRGRLRKQLVCVLAKPDPRGARLTQICSSQERYRPEYVAPFGLNDVWQIFPSDRCPSIQRLEQPPSGRIQVHCCLTFSMLPLQLL